MEKFSNILNKYNHCILPYSCCDNNNSSSTDKSKDTLKKNDKYKCLLRNTYINMLRIKKVGVRRWLVFPSTDKHHKSKLNLKSLFFQRLNPNLIVK